MEAVLDVLGLLVIGAVPVLGLLELALGVVVDPAELVLPTVDDDPAFWGGVLVLVVEPEEDVDLSAGEDALLLLEGAFPAGELALAVAVEAVFATFELVNVNELSGLLVVAGSAAAFVVAAFVVATESAADDSAEARIASERTNTAGSPFGLF